MDSVIEWLRHAAGGPRRWVQQDPLGSLTFVLLSVCALIPLCFTPILPFVDLAMTTAAGALMQDAALGRGVIGHHFGIQWQPVPYWTSYLVTAAIEPVFGIFVAAKVQVSAAILLLPWGLRRFASALGLDPRIGLSGFLLAYNHNLYWGFAAFLIGMGLVLFALARVVNVNTWRQALAVTPWGVLIAITHAQALQFFGIACVALLLVKRDWRRQLPLHVVAAAGGGVVILPWVVQRLTDRGGASFTAAWDSLATKAGSLFRFTTSDLGGPSYNAAAGVAFLGALLVPILAAALPRATLPDRRGSAGIILLLLAVAFYLILPMTIWRPMYHWYNYPRFAVVILALLPLASRPVIRGRGGVALVASITAICLFGNVAAARQFSDFGKLTQPFLKVIEAIRPNCKLIVLPYENDAAGVTNKFALEHLHAYAAGAKKCYDSRLFDNPVAPLVYRRDRILPTYPWRRPEKFRQELHAPHYDYILVQGLTRDPVRPGVFGAVTISRVLEAGRWRLYSVRPSVASANPGP